MASAESTTTPPTAPAPARSPLFAAVIGLASLGVLLQGLWAGLFSGGDLAHREGWVTVHQIGGTVTGALALIAAVVALVQLRHRRELVIGSIVFLVLVVAEIGLGEAIQDTRGLTAVHFPLALLLMALAVWLPLRASSRRA